MKFTQEQNEMIRAIMTWEINDLKWEEDVEGYNNSSTITKLQDIHNLLKNNSDGSSLTYEQLQTVEYYVRKDYDAELEQDNNSEIVQILSSVLVTLAALKDTFNVLTVDNIGSVVAYNGIVHVLYNVGEHDCVIRTTILNRVELLQVSVNDIDVIDVNTVDERTLQHIMFLYDKLQGIEHHTERHALADIYNVLQNSITDTCIKITNEAIKNIKETLEGC